MKVVLFCGGFWVRGRNGGAAEVPKPEGVVGAPPPVWDRVGYYAHFWDTE